MDIMWSMYWGCLLRPSQDLAGSSTRSSSSVLVGRGTWTLEPGDQLWIQGSNGQGKTTLLQPVLGLKHPVPSFWERMHAYAFTFTRSLTGFSSGDHPKEVLGTSLQTCVPEWTSSQKERSWFLKGWLGSDALGFEASDVEALEQASHATPSRCPPFLRLEEVSHHQDMSPSVTLGRKEGLSTGQRRKVCLGRQLRLGRWLMMWDEGLNGLDWRSRRACLDWMRHHFLKEGGCWVFVDHLSSTSSASRSSP